MQKHLLLVFFIFLACTSEMQLVAASSVLGANAATSKEVAVPTTASSIEAIQKMQALAQGAMDLFKSKYDANGHYQTIVNYFTKKTESQNLVQMANEEMVELGNKCFLAASVLSIFGTICGNVEFELALNLLKKPLPPVDGEPVTISYIKFIRVQIMNLLFFASAALWLQGFVYFTQLSLNNGDDARVLGPLLLKLLACVLFLIQPMLTLMKFMKPSTIHEKKSGDTHWFNFYAILALHIGNLLSTAFGFQKHFGSIKLSPDYFKEGVPSIASLVFLLATTFLLVSDSTVQEQSGHPLNQAQKYAYPAIGQALLLFGSCFFLFQKI